MTNPTARRLRVGIFGVGRMGRVHLEHLLRLHQASRIELAAIGDRVPQTLESACAGLPEAVARSDTPEQMCREAPDAVVVASRTTDHARDLLAFARRGIPVLVEKPLTRSIDEAAAIERELGAGADRLVQVAFQRHFDEPARAALRWISQGLIGSIQQSHHVLQDKNPTPVGYDSAGITADMAIHLVYEAMSIRRFTLPQRVQALQFMAPPYEDRAGEGANIVHVFCQWPDGSLAHLWGSRINGTGYDNGFTITGTDGRIDVGEFVGDFGPVMARLWRGTGRGPIARGTLAESLEFPMTPPRAEHPDFYARFGAAYDGELCAFLDAAASGARLEPGLDIGWKTLLVANAAEASSRQHGRVIELTTAGGGAFESAAEAAAASAAAGMTLLTTPSPRV
ncbi:MAG TPA: Gfo/Idh/MocA family oxidoreductase [Vicinamibacterales bacterium]|nr:Gfo/Idh/MocA family oxidoreductase [Vicinamibacterales bacterium]